MNINKETVIVIVILAVLYYLLSEVLIETAEDFNIISFDSSENFCSGYGCRHSRHFRRYNYNYPYYRYYYNPWNYFWGYLPCVDTVNGGTYCW